MHGSLRSLFPEALRSLEVDVASFDDTGADADLIDGSIGELSMFHSTFGYYAQGATEMTAVLPEGWRERLVVYEAPGTGGVRAHCLDMHDLWISKAIAGRDKDREFCDSLQESGLVDRTLLAERLNGVDGLDAAVRTHVEGIIRRRPA